MMRKADLKNELLLPGNTTGCLLIHGYTSTPEEIKELGEKLNIEGYTVLNVTLPGGGKSQVTYLDWIKSVEEGYEKLRRSCRKIYFIGHSMGALLALYMAEKYVFSKIVLLSPPLMMKNKTVNFAFVLKHFRKYSNLKPKKEIDRKDGFSVSADKIALESLDQFNMLKSIVKLNLSKIEEPMLVIYSDNDQIVDERSIKVIEKAVHSKDIKKVYLKESTHNSIAKSEKGIISEEVLQFLRS
jgi:carboxylesterase